MCSNSNTSIVGREKPAFTSIFNNHNENILFEHMTFRTGNTQPPPPPCNNTPGFVLFGFLHIFFIYLYCVLRINFLFISFYIRCFMSKTVIIFLFFFFFLNFVPIETYRVLRYSIPTRTIKAPEFGSMS